MCGIVAYHGPSPALPSLLSGLSRLEYRGYDSVGLALSTAGGERLTIHRAAGRLAALLEVLPMTALIALSGSATPVGRRTAHQPNPTRTRTWTAQARWPWCITAR